MTRSDTLIKLLLVDDSVESAEQIISILRNGGIAVRPARAGNDAELEEALAVQPPDVIIVSLDGTQLNMAHIHEAAERGGRDVAIIATGNTLNDDAIVQAFRDGARAAMLRSSHEHVQMITRREFEALMMRRNVRRLEAALRELELASTLNLRNARHAEDSAPLDAECRCIACTQFSRAYLHHVVKSNEIIASMLLRA